MSLNFESYAKGGHEFVKRVAAELNTKDTDRAGRITRCVLHALRNRITVEESFHLIAQLPMAIRAVYVDGWKVNASYVRVKDLEDFLSEIIKEDGTASWRDFSGIEDAQNAAWAVFRVLSYYASPGEINNVLGVLPEQLKDFLKEAIVA